MIFGIKPWLIIGGTVVVITALSAVYFEGRSAGYNACKIEQKIADEQFRIKVEIDNEKRRKDNIQSLIKHSIELNKIKKERDHASAHWATVQQELQARGANHVQLRCARDASGLRSLYTTVFGVSAIPVQSDKTNIGPN